MKEPIPTAGIIIFRNVNQHKQVLLVKHLESAEHITGLYGIPSGRVETNEIEIQTAIRELFEETGIIVSQDNIFELPNIYTAEIQTKTKKLYFSLKVYIANKFSGKLRSNHETFAEWINIQDIDKLPLLPNIKTTIIDAMLYQEQII